jgi:glycosyltransferase involved in cell wall biosynthesis
MSIIPGIKISGFSLVRNGTLFDYPYLESLRSLLPMVDELIVNVGIGDDDTLEQVQKFADTEGQEKLIIFESDWQLDQPAKKKGGLILSEQTNAALDRCSGDWCFYLQADEVIHEDDRPALQTTLQAVHSNPQVEGILFDYLHFYGSFDVIQDSRSTYRREVRIVRRNSNPRSVGDAQSFRKKDGTKLSVVRGGGRIFHYGWVRNPEAMKEKTFFMDQLYHGNPSENDLAQKIPHTGDNYRYKRFWGLKSFRKTHPAVMGSRIEKKGWHWDLAHSPFHWSLKDSKKIVLDLIERLTQIRLFEYRSYVLLRNIKGQNPKQQTQD